MELTTALALIGATAVLVAIPGPNVALFVAHTITHGLRFGVVTVLGTTIGVALQLLVVVGGLAIVLEFASFAFVWLKWAGVAYLIYLGVTSWRNGVENGDDPTVRRASMPSLFSQGLMLATLNPKTLLFSAAFLPQFVSGETTASYHLLLPALLYLGVVLIGDLCWVVLAQSVKPLLMKLGRVRNRLMGSLFFGAGVGLALARVER